MIKKSVCDPERHRDCDIDAAPGVSREALIKSIYDELPIWRRRVWLKERYTPPKPKAVSTKPAGPKWIKAKKSDNIYCKLPAGTFTCFAVGTEWGISWFPVGGTMPIYDKADNALRLYDTRDAARLAAEIAMQHVPAGAPPPPQPWKYEHIPTAEELGLPRQSLPPEVLNKMIISGPAKPGNKWDKYLPAEWRQT
jgi:hypothetical protein